MCSTWFFTSVSHVHTLFRPPRQPIVVHILQNPRYIILEINQWSTKHQNLLHTSHRIHESSQRGTRIERYQLIEYFAIFYILRFHPESSLTCWEIKTEAPGQSPLNGDTFYTIQACKLLFPQTDSTSKTFTPTMFRDTWSKKVRRRPPQKTMGGEKMERDKKHIRGGLTKKK